MLGPSHPDTKVRCTVMMIRPCRPYGIIIIPYCFFFRIYDLPVGREASSGCSTSSCLISWHSEAANTAALLVAQPTSQR